MNQSTPNQSVIFVSHEDLDIMHTTTWYIIVPCCVFGTCLSPFLTWYLQKHVHLGHKVLKGMFMLLLYQELLVHLVTLIGVTWIGVFERHDYLTCGLFLFPLIFVYQASTLLLAIISGTRYYLTMKADRLHVAKMHHILIVTVILMILHYTNKAFLMYLDVTTTLPSIYSKCRLESKTGPEVLSKVSVLETDKFWLRL